MKKELAIIFILSLSLFSACEVIRDSFKVPVESESSYGSDSLSIAINSIESGQIAVTLKWTATLSSARSEKPSIAYFIPGTTWGFTYSQISFPFVWFNSSAWRLLDSDNKTYWRWQVTNVLYSLPWSQEWPGNFSGSPTLFYPFEIFSLDVYVATTHYLAGSSPPPFVNYAGPRELAIEDRLSERLQDPYLSIIRQFSPLGYQSLPSDFVYRLGQLNFAQSATYYHIRVIVEHRFEVRLLAWLGIVFLLFVQPLLLFRIYKMRNLMDNDNYVQTCVGFLVFLPILLFTFRTSIGPPWVTNFDLLLLLSVFAWAVLLTDRFRQENYQKFISR